MGCQWFYRWQPIRHMSGFNTMCQQDSIELPIDNGGTVLYDFTLLHTILLSDHNITHTSFRRKVHTCIVCIVCTRTAREDGLCQDLTCELSSVSWPLF